MTSSFKPSPLPPLTRPLEQGALADQRQQLKHHMTACRASTLALARSLTATEYYRQSHPEFSPIGWHLGHIAFTEALWMLEHLAGRSNPLAEHRLLFAADGLPKAAREQLPALPTVLSYLAEVRHLVWIYLEQAPVNEQLRLWWWLLQHESQHLETISIVLALHRRAQGRYLLSDRPLGFQGRAAISPPLEAPRQNCPMVLMPGAEISMGYDGIDAIDNEQPPFTVWVAPFYIDAHPVTQGAFRDFIAAGGYNTPAYWSSQGWSWRLTAEVDRPLYWSRGAALDDHPVCGVSYYEAEAYASFVGKRLPTELEWERAACWDATGQHRGLYPWGSAWPEPSVCNSGGLARMTTAVELCSAGTAPGGCQDLLGNVWEWTASWFDGYPGFEAYPYRGYSEVYFDGQHRVLRGGSWATRSWALRGTLRNWYHPYVREIFAGFRCVKDAS